MLNSLKSLIVDPYWFIGCYLKENHPKWMSDKYYLSIQFRQFMGYKLNWKNPKTFNEKLAWLKLYDRNPLYTKLVDKYEVKKWVSDKIGDKFIIPTIGVWDKFEDIDFDELPNQFVLKCTHDSGSVVICMDKSSFDFNSAKEKLNKALSRNFYWWAREWPYKNVKPRIIAENFIVNNSCSRQEVALKDYKFFCFNGIPKFMYISDDHGEDPHTDFFDMNFDRIPMQFKDRNSNQKICKPAEFDEMKYLAKELSNGIPFVRTDFYVSNGNIFFGEMTFYHNGGYFPIKPVEMNTKIGQMIDQSKI